MLVPVDFVYSVNVKLARKQNQEAISVRDQVIIEIKEISEDDAPVVMWVPTEAAQQGESTGKYPVRFHNGQFWQPATTGFGSSGRFVNRGSVREFLNFQPEADLAAARSDLNGADIKEVFHSNREKIASDILEDTAEGVIIGEMLYQTTIEPHYTFSMDGGRASVEILHRQPSYNPYIWPANQFDNVLEHARQALTDDGNPEDFVERRLQKLEVYRIDLERPDLLFLDLPKIAVEKAAEMLIAGLKRNADMWLDRANMDLFAAFIEVRDICSMADVDRREHFYGDLINGLSTLTSELNEAGYTMRSLTQATFAVERQIAEWQSDDVDLTAIETPATRP